ncbi:MAG: protein kinase domain-containing protein [Thainema sp.]
MIRIGRSTDNHVVLYSAVVSRHHVELRQQGNQWEIVNLGTNGTYVDGKRITQMPAQDGVIIRLARSGPNIQILMGQDALQHIQKMASENQAVGQSQVPVPGGRTAVVDDTPLDEADTPPKSSVIPVPDHLRLPDQPEPARADYSETTRPDTTKFDASDASDLSDFFDHSFGMDTSHGMETHAEYTVPRLRPKQLDDGPPLSEQMQSDCPHANPGKLFCRDCGKPLHPLMAIAGYQIVGQLGRGEVGVTYWAWQEGFDQEGHNVVMKTLNPDWAGHPQAREAFQREADLLHQLHHSRIPRLLDYIEVNGQLYLIMELIRGPTLAQWIRKQGPVIEADAARWMMQLCDVLSYLHRQSPPILHRNLNPSSLVLRGSPTAQLELAVVNFDVIEHDLLGVDRPSGLSVYSAPEEMGGELDATTDLYALGPLLIFLLTGQSPELYYGTRDQGRRLYPEYVTGLSNQMTHIIRTLTHPEPMVRYASAESVAADLRSLAEG